MPLNESWDQFKQLHPLGNVLVGHVTRHATYGFYVDLGEPFEGLVDIINFTDDPPLNASIGFPAAGQLIKAVVLGYKDRTFQVSLGTRASDFPRDTGKR